MGRGFRWVSHKTKGSITVGLPLLEMQQDYDTKHITFSIPQCITTRHVSPIMGWL